MTRYASIPATSGVVALVTGTCRMQELKAVNEELQRSAEEKAELSAQLEAERVGPCT